MKSIFESDVRKEILDRVARLKPDAKPAWGKMNCAQMVQHCARPLQASMGEMAVEPKAGPLRNPLLRYVVIYIMPWPKGVPTAPEFVPAAGGDLEASRQELSSTLERFAAHAARGAAFVDHPAFGALSTKHWGCLTWRHLDHHLRQFGV